jgi:hypothetical protein
MKTIAIPILAVVLSFNLSCQKEQDEIVTKTINVTLAPGETYSNILTPHGKEDFSITLQAEHASLSVLQKGSNHGDMNFTYIASSDYNGNDQVQITGEAKGHCPMQHNNETTVYVYKINVSGETH